MNDKKLIVFTFQYGSTLISSTNKKLYAVCIFTFQYGSTLIISDIFIPKDFKYLHSNMVLL